MRDPRRLPKAHLHLHLESAIRWPTLRELAAANGVPVPAEPAPGTVFEGFRPFADLGEAVRACLRTPDDFERVARELVEDQAADGVGWVEVTFTAASHGERLGDSDMPLAAVLRGLAAGSAAHGAGTAVILDHSRRRSVARFERTVALAERHPEVVAVGLAGDEAHSLAPFVPVISSTAVPMVHHAGESAGAASVREALGPGRAVRIGHGIRCLEDPALVAELRERQLPLEVCPASNVALGFAPSLAAHPLPALLDAGLAVALGTDIPAVIGATLSGEYAAARDTHARSDEELALLAVASVRASFAPPQVRDRLFAGILGWLDAP